MTVPLSYRHPDYRAEVDRLKALAWETHAPSPRLSLVAWVAVGIGVLGFLVGLALNPGHAWGAFLAAFTFWSGLAQCCIVLACVINVGGARWGRNIQRFIEPAGLFVVFLPLLYLVVWFGRSHEFIWLEQTLRSPWLDSIWMLLRDECVLVGMAVLSLWWLYGSIRPDLNRPAPADTGLLADRVRGWVTRDWRGSEEEVRRSQTVLRNLAPFVIAAYCFGYGILSIDLTMTVDPHFKSTMLPGIYWVSEFAAALGLCAMILLAWTRGNPRATSAITPSNVMDLGNLIWGFAIFRNWFDWSQYIIIWYGNLPDESHYLAERWRTHPWDWLAYVSLGLVFIGPFLAGFNRSFKRNRATCAVLGGMVFVGVLLRRFVDLMPSIPHLGPADFGLFEVAITIGFAGAVALPYLWLLKWVPLYPASDPAFVRGLEIRGMEEV